MRLCRNIPDNTGNFINCIPVTIAGNRKGFTNDISGIKIPPGSAFCNNH